MSEHSNGLPSVGDFVDRRSREEIAEEEQRGTLAILRLEKERQELYRLKEMAQYIVAHANQECPTQPPAPTKERRISDVERFSQRVGMDRNEVLKRCRHGSILAHQDNGPGGKWRIHPEEDERYLREGPYVPTR